MEVKTLIWLFGSDPVSNRIPPGFLDKLIDFLLSIVAMQRYENRTALLRGLPAGPVGTIQRSPAILPDLRTIVDTVVTWGVVADSNQHALTILIDNAMAPVRGTAQEGELVGLREDLHSILSFLDQCMPVANQEQVMPFTNREDEIRLVLSSYAPAYYLLDGPAGYGKTELLKELKRRFTEQRWSCAYVSVEERDTLADLVAALANELGITPAQHLELPWSARLGGALYKQWVSDPKEGLALLIDLEKRPSLTILKELLNDFIPAVQDNLRNLDFFEKNHNRFRVILAGRYLAASQETKDTPVQLKDLRLAPFDHDVIRDSAEKYLTRFARDRINQLAAHLVYLTGGHPGCVRQILEIYKTAGVNPDRFLGLFGNKIWRDIVRWAVEAVRAEVPQIFPGFREMLDDLSVFRCLDATVLDQMRVERGITEVHSGYSLADKLTATYLFTRRGRLLQDDITRRLLSIRLRNEAPEEFSARCRKAQQMSRERISNPRQPECWVVEYLFQTLQEQANAIGNQKQRDAIHEKFFAQAVPQALQMFVDGRDILPEARQEEKQVLDQAMTADWEFRFTVNYYLRKRQYNDEPFKELRRQVERFFVTL